MSLCNISPKDAFFAGFNEYTLDLLLNEKSKTDEAESLELRAKYLITRKIPQSYQFPSNQAVIQLFHFLTCMPDLKETYVYQILNLAKSDNAIACFIAACVLCHGVVPNSIPRAFSLTKNKATDELILLRAAQFVLIDRYDLLQSFLQSNKPKSLIFNNLAESFRLLATGKYADLVENINEIENEFTAKVPNSVSTFLRTQKGVAYMHLRDWEKAMEQFESLCVNEINNSEDVLANLVTCCTWLNKENERNKYFELLALINPNHHYVNNITRLLKAAESFTFQTN